MIKHVIICDRCGRTVGQHYTPFELNKTLKLCTAQVKNVDRDGTVSTKHLCEVCMKFMSQHIVKSSCVSSENNSENRGQNTP